MKEIVWNWFTAIGLQQVDGLKVSEYLYDIAKRSMDGQISTERAKRFIDNYYRCGEGLKEDDFFEEADKVSSRIVKVLSEPSFSFSVSYLISIHKKLFERHYNLCWPKQQILHIHQFRTHCSFYIFDKLFLLRLKNLRLQIFPKHQP